LTTQTSQIVERIYRNDKAPKVVIQTKDGNKYSCYDGSNISENIHEGQQVTIPFKQNGQWKNITGPVTVAAEQISWDSPEYSEQVVANEQQQQPTQPDLLRLKIAVDEDIELYAYIYHELVAKKIPEKLANTSASTIFIQQKRRK